MKNNLLCLFFLLQTCCFWVINASERSRCPWPKSSDVNEWPVPLHNQNATPSQQWPPKRDLSERNPFENSQDDISSLVPLNAQEPSEVTDDGDVATPVLPNALLHDARLPKGLASLASSQESFFDCDWSSFQRLTFPVQDLIDEERDLRVYYEDIRNAEMSLLKDENRLITDCFRERIDMYQRSVEYIKQFDALCAIIMHSKQGRFSVMHARKGSLKMRGLYQFFEEICSELLSECNDKQFLWEQCVYACSIYQISAQRVANMLES